MKRILFLFLLFFIVSIDLPAIEVTNLTCEMSVSPMALVSKNPRFGWQMKANKQGAMQTAYEIEIRNRESGYNGSKVTSNKSQLIPYAGRALHPGEKYTWRVRVWDENDRPSAWSTWAEFRMAPEPSYLDASWIGAIRTEDARIPAGKRFLSYDMGTPDYKAIWKAIDTLSSKSIYLRKSVHIKKTITEATAYVCGLGHYEFSLNGAKVGDAEFAPFWSDYNKTVYYNTFDITHLLRKGENVAGVILGNGFYNQQGGVGRYSKLKVAFGAPTLFLKMTIRYSDGSSEEFCSDKTWKYSLSPITFNSIYGGEDYDARMEQTGWNAPGFNEKNWLSVVTQTAPTGILTPQQAAPVKIMERYAQKSVKKLNGKETDSASLITKRTIDPSAFVLDMGQNLSGFPEITVQGKRGDKITLLVGEALTQEGAVNQNQTGRQHYYRYTLKGGGDETWRPRFSYYGFRYIQVEGAVRNGDKNPGQLPVLKDIKSCFVYNSAPQTSTFTCSNDIFNNAHRLILKAVESNMQAVFTDCPHREKLAWLEEVHLNGPVLMYNYNLSAFMPKVMQDMADAQLPNGIVPTIAPMYNIFGTKKGFDEFGDSPEWGSTMIILPWMYLDFYGDSTLIKTYYPNMLRYVDYLTSRSESNIISFGLGDWYDYGDFKAGYSRNTPVPLVATAYYYYDLTLLAKAAGMVGNKIDAEHYHQLSEEVRASFNSRFFDKATNTYGTGSQTAYALAVYLDIVEPQNRQAVLDNLVQDIHKHGNRLTTGDIGNRYLFQTLAQNGFNELMYTMHNHEEAPGYGFQLKFGATTLTEQWDPRMGSSWNHFMMGQIDEWFFASLAGIRSNTKKPGFQHLVIHPEVTGDMTFVKASYETLYGKVTVDWKREAKDFTLNITIPVNCTADVYLPGETVAKPVKSGSYMFAKVLE
jgi:alpha-L-rhamnosidase